MMIESVSRVPEHLSLRAAAPRGPTPAETSLLASGLQVWAAALSFPSGPAGLLGSRQAGRLLLPRDFPGGAGEAKLAACPRLPTAPPRGRGELETQPTSAVRFDFIF